MPSIQSQTTTRVTNYLAWNTYTQIHFKQFWYSRDLVGGERGMGALWYSLFYANCPMIPNFTWGLGLYLSIMNTYIIIDLEADRDIFSE